MATGRTVPKYFKFQVDDSGGTMRDLPVFTVNDIGLDFAEENGLVAWQDAVMGSLSGLPDFAVDIGGPFSNVAAQAASGSGAAAALSGSHTVLNNLPGGVTPLGFGIYFGIQSIWSTGDPVFGLTASAVNGLLCFSYKPNPSTMLYTARFRMIVGSAVPAWGTAVIT